MDDNSILDVYQIDWQIFMAGVQAWLEGRSPYEQLNTDFSAGAFAYPPTALPWLAFFFNWARLDIMCGRRYSLAVGG